MQKKKEEPRLERDLVLGEVRGAFIEIERDVAPALTLTRTDEDRLASYLNAAIAVRERMQEAIDTLVALRAQEQRDELRAIQAKRTK